VGEYVADGSAIPELLAGFRRARERMREGNPNYVSHTGQFDSTSDVAARLGAFARDTDLDTLTTSPASSHRRWQWHAGASDLGLHSYRVQLPSPGWLVDPHPDCPCCATVYQAPFYPILVSKAEQTRAGLLKRTRKQLHKMRSRTAQSRLTWIRDFLSPPPSHDTPPPAGGAADGPSGSEAARTNAEDGPAGLALLIAHLPCQPAIRAVLSYLDISQKRLQMHGAQAMVSRVGR
jgi:hypothetical protein